MDTNVIVDKFLPFEKCGVDRCECKTDYGRCIQPVYQNKTKCFYHYNTSPEVNIPGKKSLYPWEK